MPIKRINHERNSKQLGYYDLLFLTVQSFSARLSLPMESYDFWKCQSIRKCYRNRRPFKCEHCDMVFGRAGGLRRHDMMVHQQIIHACPYEGCDHPGYKCTKALTAHIRSVHTLDRPFKCLFCERSFVRKNDLKVHETTHSTQSEYVCKNNTPLSE
ncbi:unnamed protein product, partial [Cylicostephanus goldi]